MQFILKIVIKRRNITLIMRQKNNFRSLKSRGQKLKPIRSENFDFSLNNTIDYSKNENNYFNDETRKEPLIKLPLNDSLLHDYWCMLDKDNNKDVNIFAIQSLEPIISDSVRIIINDPEKFLCLFNLVEMFTLPFDVQELQYRITVKAFVVTPKMTKNSIIFRGGYDKGYKFFIADEHLFVCILIFCLHPNKFQ